MLCRRQGQKVAAWCLLWQRAKIPGIPNSWHGYTCTTCSLLTVTDHLFYVVCKPIKTHKPQIPYTETSKCDASKYAMYAQKDTSKTMGKQTTMLQ